ncbi:MAG: MFS transporter [Herpetosiphonaceae bacterium]|nr:MFS transporter [Herpetosiphonaceae bacterium]
MNVQRSVIKAVIWGISTTTILGIMIAVGSRNLAHFDAALVAYTFATLFATFGVTYRYVMWLQRPPTTMYWRRGWQVFFRRSRLFGNAGRLAQRVTVDVAGNRFIWRRGKLRWMAHWFIMWGCIIAFAITFPLVFGWLHFATVPGNFESYRAYIFGFPLFDFPVHSVIAFFLFHGLVWSSFAVIVGVMLAMWRRMREHGAAALQQFVEDILPLVLLFAISVTGVMLTASYTWMRGYAFDFIAILHAITVIFTLLYMPFGKFFHIFQRPAQLGASFYKDAGATGEQAICRRCEQPYSSRMHIEDLITVEQKLGYRYEVDGPVEHYQWICPPCRRAMFVLAQTRLWQGQHGDQMISGDPELLEPTRFGNPVVSAGPLGSEDRANLHF